MNVPKSKIKKHYFSKGSRRFSNEVIFIIIEKEKRKKREREVSVNHIKYLILYRSFTNYNMCMFRTSIS